MCRVVEGALPREEEKGIKSSELLTELVFETHSALSLSDFGNISALPAWLPNAPGANTENHIKRRRRKVMGAVFYVLYCRVRH